MTVGIDDNDFYLINQFPPSPLTGGNPDSFTSYATTEALGGFSLGTQRAVYSDTNKGWSTLMYVQIEGGAEGDANGGAVKDRLGLDTARAALGESYVFNMDGGEILLNGPIAILLGTITAAQFTAQDMFGWVWIGGVCPVDLVSGLDGIYLTDGNVAAGTGMDLVDNSGPAYFGVIGTSDVASPSGFALAADSNIS